STCTSFWSTSTSDPVVAASSCATPAPACVAAVPPPPAPAALLAGALDFDVGAPDGPPAWLPGASVEAMLQLPTTLPHPSPGRCRYRPNQRTTAAAAGSTGVRRQARVSRSASRPRTPAGGRSRPGSLS